MEMTGENLVISSTSGIFSFHNQNWTQISALNSSESLATQGTKTIASGTRLMGSIVHNTTNQETFTLQDGLNLNVNSAVITSNQKIYTSSNYSNTLSHYDLNSFEWHSQSVPENVEEYTIIHDLTKSETGNALVGMNGFLLETQTDSNDMTIIGTNQTAPIDPIYGIFNASEIYSNSWGIYVRQHSAQNTLNFTADNGQTWSVINPSTAGYNIFFMTQIHTQNESIFMMGGASGFSQDVLIQSNDNGGSWTLIPHPTNEIIQEIFTSKTSELYAYTNHDKIHKWNTDTASWSVLNLNLGNNTNKNLDVIFDFNNRMYVVSSGIQNPLSTDGIHAQNTDGSFEWIPFPSENETSLPLFKLDFIQDNILIGITRNTIGNDKSGIYYFSKNVLMQTNETNTNTEKIRIYPNPTRNELNIETHNLSIEKLQIVDFTGRIIHQQDYTKKLLLGHLAKGIYGLILIDSQGNKQFERFIVR